MGTSRKDEHATEGEFKRSVRVAKAQCGLKFVTLCITLQDTFSFHDLRNFFSVYTPHLYKHETASSKHNVPQLPTWNTASICPFTAVPSLVPSFPILCLILPMSFDFNLESHILYPSSSFILIA